MPEEHWGRHYELTHLWRKVSAHRWRSHCGSVITCYEPEWGYMAEPRCLHCTKSFKRRPASPPGCVADGNVAAQQA